MSRTWVVIPVYNEGSVVGDVVSDLLPSFPHIVCVDDGSSDESAQAAHAAGAWVVTHPINLGQGASLQTGFEFALRDPEMTEVVTFDADGQHSIEDAREMVERLRNEALDVVIGSRFLDDRTTLPWIRRVVLKLSVVFTRASTGLALTDSHNGLRVIGRSLLSRIHLKQNRMAHASEILDQIAAARPKWAEHPTHIIYTDYSRAKGQSLWNSVNILVDLLFK